MSISRESKKKQKTVKQNVINTSKRYHPTLNKNNQQESKIQILMSCP